MSSTAVGSRPQSADWTAQIVLLMHQAREAIMTILGQIPFSHLVLLNACAAPFGHDHMTSYATPHLKPGMHATGAGSGPQQRKAPAASARQTRSSSSRQAASGRGPGSDNQQPAVSTKPALSQKPVPSKPDASDPSAAQSRQAAQAPPAKKRKQAGAQLPAAQQAVHASSAEAAEAATKADRALPKQVTTSLVEPASVQDIAWRCHVFMSSVE